ncbi:MAG: RIP metalloprotease RseP [Desulfobacteraceae bacterium]|jgi:regulator of sigma E protease
MNSFLVFIVVLGILIFFHELGHFIVARIFGVGVERFSLGFGPRLFGRTIGRTDYRVSLIPLGGYVKMVGDEPDAELPPEDEPISFTHKHVAKRTLIVAAGPLFNVLLAILIFTVVLFFVGLPSIRPFIRGVEPDSPAAKAGLRVDDQVTAIDGKRIQSWRDIDTILSASRGAPLKFNVRRDGAPIELEVTPEQVSAKDLFGDDIRYFGIGISGVTELQAVVDKVMEGMPAQKAGLQHGDQIVAIDDQPVERWQRMQELVSGSKGKTLTFKVRRGEEIFETQIKPEVVEEKNPLGVKQSAYRIGISTPGVVVPRRDQMTIHFNLLEAAGRGAVHTWEVTRTTIYFFGKLIRGKVPMESIGGPIRIAIMAGEEADQGFVQLLNFIALISIQLAILNILPIPVLDGGHLLFYGFEAVLRRPVSLRMRETAQQIGIFLLILLMIFVFYNDISITWFK